MKQLFTLRAKHHGPGEVLCSWQPRGSYLATVGQNRIVHIFDRHGEIIDEIGLTGPGKCRFLEWDKDGEMLAVLQENCPLISMWNSVTRETSQLDTNLKDPSFLKWSKVGPQLAIGTVKGNLILYNKRTRRMIPVMGMHNGKKITCGCWSSENLLAMGGEDKYISISNAEGEKLEQSFIHKVPESLTFALDKSDGSKRDQKERMIFANLEGDSLLLYRLDNPEKPVELTFQSRYGKIIEVTYFGNELLLLGFSLGYVIVLSTKADQIGQELFSGKFHSDNLGDVSVSGDGSRAATCGGYVVKMLDLNEMKQVREDTTHCEAEHGTIDKLFWSEDSQVLCASTVKGAVHCFLVRLPQLFDCSGGRIAVLSSLREVSVFEPAVDAPATVLSVSIEPEFLALGQRHVAVGMNNRVWYYRCDETGTELAQEKEYIGTVTAVQLSSQYAAVLSESRLSLHSIEPDDEDNTLMLPPTDSGDRYGSFSSYTAVAKKVLCHQINDQFLVFGTDAGTIETFYISEWTLLSGCEYKHTNPIHQVFPNATGTQSIVIDSTQQGYFYSPVSSEIVALEEFPEDTNTVLWDMEDPNVFVAVTSNSLQPFVISTMTLNGLTIVPVGDIVIEPNGDMSMTASNTPNDPQDLPVMVRNGLVSCKQAHSGTLSKVVLNSHSMLHERGGMRPEQLKKLFTQLMALLRLCEAWDVANSVDDRSLFLALSGKAMEQMDVTVAIRVYRKLGDAAMVLALESLVNVEDPRQLAGHIAVLFGDFQTAQDMFLSSSNPVMALDLRRDLLHFEQALKLADSLAPAQVPDISIEYAQQLEFKGQSEPALQYYDRALQLLEEIKESGRKIPVGQSGSLAGANFEQKKKICMGGIARMSLKAGDLRRGLQIAMSSSDLQLCKDCASVLEGMKQYADAAHLYERGECYEKAVAIYILSKNVAGADPLISKVSAPKLLLQYGKAKVKMEDYNAAFDAFLRAGDLDHAVELLLTKLRLPEEAFRRVREAQSPSSAKILARHCKAVGDHTGFIEFMMLSGSRAEAFSMAEAEDLMPVYTKFMGDSAGNDEFQQVARYYETKGEMALAGDYYRKCKKFHKALKLYLTCGENRLMEAIRMIREAGNEILTHTLIGHLMGESDGEPKDPKYIFEVYRILKKFREAANTARVIARQERQLGNYVEAHKMLVLSCVELGNEGIQIPRNLVDDLMLLHSYILVKKHVRRSDHLNAALLLVRVCRNISRFSSHVVQILTSTVIECHRSGMKRTANEYASTLMQPEHRTKIDPKFKRNIERLVRKPNTSEIAEPESPCPYCENLIKVTALSCDRCKNTLPFCIASGWHVVKDELCVCKQCKFPAIRSKLEEHLASEPKCPLCDVAMSQKEIEPVDDAAQWLARAAGVEEEEGGEATEEAKEEGEEEED